MASHGYLRAAMRSLLIVVTAALPLLALPLAAQSPAQPIALSEPCVVPIHTLAADPIGGGGGTFAAGRDYKVAFGGGMQFVPYLGAGYPHNQPFAWRTAAITIGGVAVPLRAAAGNAASPTLYAYDLGVAVEAYAVGLDGLEQTFTFAAAPGKGELRIRGALTTALRTADGDRGHAAIAFADAAGVPIVGYGACTAIDANGRRFALRTVVDGAAIELVLAAEHVAAAAWPLVVDPLLSNLLLSTSGTLPLGQPRATDVARDDENNQLMVAIQRHASATDEDTFLRLFSDGFASSLGLVFADVDTTWDTTEPKVTFVGGADRWVAVFTRAFDSLGTKAVRWHPHVAASAVLGTTVGFLTPPAGSSELHPCVGGYAGFTTGVHAVVAWQRDSNLGAGGTHTIDPDSRLYFARIDVTGASSSGGSAGTVGATTEIVSTDPSGGGSDRERPAINRTSNGSGSGHFLIAYQTYWNTAPGGVDDWDVEGKRIDAAGAFLPGTWISSNNFPNGDHKLGPVVDGTGDEYVVACNLADNTAIPFKTLAIEGSRVVCESYDFGVPAIGAPQVLADTGFVKSLVVTGLSYDSLTRSHALVVHHDVLVDSVHVTKLGYQNRAMETFTAYATAGQVALGGGAVHDDDADRHAFVFGVEDGATQPVYGNLVTYVATPSPVVYGNPGCAQGTIAWSSYHRLGHEHGALMLLGGSPTALAFAGYSLAPANIPLAAAGFGNCTLLLDPNAPAFLGTSTAVTDASGFAQVGLPVPDLLPPLTCYFQWLVVTGPLVNTTASPGLAVGFDR